MVTKRKAYEAADGVFPRKGVPSDFAAAGGEEEYASTHTHAHAHAHTHTHTHAHTHTHTHAR